MILRRVQRALLRTLATSKGLHACARLRQCALPPSVKTQHALSSGHLRWISTAEQTSSEDNVNMSRILVEWPGVYRVPLSHVITSCSDDAEVLAEAKKHFIEPHLWKTFVPAYRRTVVKDPIEAFGSVEDLRAVLDACGDLVEPPTDDKLRAIRDSILPRMFRYAAKAHATEIAAFKALCNTSDLRLPHEWFPYARLMKRKIYYHGGPTNSGKTYRALMRLKQARPEYGGGLYCGPLRLLALEVYEQLNAQGVYCDLVTGQEQRHMPFATHVACTVEMINFNKEYDVAVIDEIQMIGHEQRGHCWTRALQGLRAKEIHVCGGLEARKIVTSLVENLQDDLEVLEYNRLSPLHVAETSLKGDYSQIQPGDCVVAFNRADIFSIKREIEASTPHKCCVVYGQLPPETRSQQARLFNEENTGYDVLVASDAIGMGLNLNIRRIIFHTTLKLQESNRVGYVDPSLAKQIAGRAGRASSKHKEGIVTAWQDVDLAYVRAVMDEDTPIVAKAGLFPTVEQVEYFAEQLSQMFQDQNTRLSSLLMKFVELAQIDGRYSISAHDDLVAISNFLHPIPLTLAQRFTFANAPVNIRDRLMMHRLYQFATSVALDKAVSMNMRLPATAPSNVNDLSGLCTKHNELDLYLWLAQRFPKNFVEKDICLAQKKHAITLIDSALNSSRLRQATSHITAHKALRTKFNEQHGTDLHPNLTFTKKMSDFLGGSKGLVYPKHSVFGAEARSKHPSAGADKQHKGPHKPGSFKDHKKEGHFQHRSEHKPNPAHMSGSRPPQHKPRHSPKDSRTRQQDTQVAATIAKTESITAII